MTDEPSNAVTNGVSNGSSNGAQTRPVVVIPKGITTRPKASSSAIPSPDAIDAAAGAELEADRVQMRLGEYLSRRPVRFTAPGEIHPDLLAWAQRFHAGATGNLVITGSTGTGKSWSRSAFRCRRTSVHRRPGMPPANERTAYS